MKHQDNEKPASKALVTGVVLFYLVAALAMVIANKWVLNATDIPLFFLWTQLALAALLFIACDMCRLLPDRLTFDLQTSKGLFPMVALNVVGLSFSNYTLKYVDASFYQVARGLVLPFTVGTSFIMLHARPSLKILIACLVVTMGFFIGVFLDGARVSVIGVLFGVASSAITAVHSVIIKQSLKTVNGSALALSWYMNSLSAILLIPIVLLAGEGPAVNQLLFTNTIVELGKADPYKTFILGSLITGLLGFMMSIASLMSIKVTSPITHMVSSAVRGVAASLLGIWLFRDIITTGRASSIAVILGGSAMYTWFKHQESLGPSHPPASNKRGSYERLKMEDIDSDVEKGKH
ncbi:hypothetical protein FA15DRAFT_668520 [Coprinopsis marcescibilis]|uniref:Sugar phosphate transporter domain-containing protein n=1 Tax=Coprinopsis marcescibilis TaxID=230819 RepID=A0A5C3KYC3_COPMA|nr:hypothetical protein FA15DRAFT_668520 [Coprinopsis marcescibilis]